MPGPLTFDLNAQRARTDIGDALGLAARPQQGQPGMQMAPNFPQRPVAPQGAQQPTQGMFPPQIAQQLPPWMQARMQQAPQWAPPSPTGAPQGAPPPQAPGAMLNQLAPQAPGMSPQYSAMLNQLRQQVQGAQMQGVPQSPPQQAFGGQNNPIAARIAQLMQRYGQQ